MNTDVRRSGRSSRITNIAKVDDEDDESEDQEEKSLSGVDNSKHCKLNYKQCRFKSDYKANLVRHEEKQQKKRKATTQAQVSRPTKQPRIFQCEECSHKCGYKLNKFTRTILGRRFRVNYAT